MVATPHPAFDRSHLIVRSRARRRAPGVHPGGEARPVAAAGQTKDLINRDNHGAQVSVYLDYVYTDLDALPACVADGLKYPHIHSEWTTTPPCRPSGARAAASRTRAPTLIPLPFAGYRGSASSTTSAVAALPRKALRASGQGLSDMGLGEPDLSWLRSARSVVPDYGYFSCNYINACNNVSCNLFDSGAALASAILVSCWHRPRSRGIIVCRVPPDRPTQK